MTRQEDSINEQYRMYMCGHQDHHQEYLCTALQCS